jgi:hypothetical protein
VPFGRQRAGARGGARRVSHSTPLSAARAQAASQGLVSLSSATGPRAIIRFLNDRWNLNACKIGAGRLGAALGPGCRTITGLNAIGGEALRCLLYFPTYFPTCLLSYLTSHPPTHLPTYLPTCTCSYPSLQRRSI